MGRLLLASFKGLFGLGVAMTMALHQILRFGGGTSRKRGNRGTRLLGDGVLALDICYWPRSFAGSELPDGCV